MPGMERRPATRLGNHCSTNPATATYTVYTLIIYNVYPVTLQLLIVSMRLFDYINLSLPVISLQVVKQLDVLSGLGTEHGSDTTLDVLKQAMAVAQHHDAVSGTAKQVVTYDYEERLSDGVTQCMRVVNDAYQKLMAPQGANATAYSLPLQEFCPLLNISRCNLTETNHEVAAFLYSCDAVLYQC